MSTLFEKIAAVATEVASERGAFTLFAIMHRADAPDWWDVVVAAPWLDAEGMKDYRYFAQKLGKFHDWDQTPRLSHVSILKLDNPVVRALLASRDLEVGKICAINEPAGPVDFDKGFLVARKPVKLTIATKSNTRSFRAKTPSARTSPRKKAS
jgi:hypothetical protein